MLQAINAHIGLYMYRMSVRPFKNLEQWLPLEKRCRRMDKRVEDDLQFPLYPSVPFKLFNHIKAINSDFQPRWRRM